MHFDFPSDRFFHFGVAIDRQPSWEDALAYLGGLSGQELLEAQRLVLALEGANAAEIEDYLPEEGEDQVALLLLVQELAELSLFMQDEMANGRQAFEWAFTPGAIPSISGGQPGRSLLVFLLLGVVQAAGFTPLLREE